MINLFGHKVKTKEINGKQIPYQGEELNDVLSIIKGFATTKIDKSATDIGTCVLGAGIKLKTIRKGQRKYYSTTMFFSAPFQGNVGSYRALKPVLEYLKSEYPQFGFYWDDGVMD